MKTLRIACVGAGYFSRFHYGSWVRMDRVRLVGACDTDIARAQATGLPAYDDLAEMLTQTTPDIVDIIAPSAEHAGAIETCIATGAKWIICQKPFCANLLEAQRIVALADRAGATVIAHENFRFQPWYRTIKAALDNNAVGQPLQATFRLRPGDGQGPRAYLDRQPYFQQMQRFLIHETGVHFIDTFRYLFGDPTAVYADLRQINPALSGEDAGVVLFDHPGGVRAVFDGNRHLDHAADNLRRTMGEALIEGTEGCLALAGDGSVTRRGFHSSAVETLVGPDTWQGFGGDCVHALQCHVVNGVLDGSAMENHARDYLTVLKTEAAIYRSAMENRKIELELA